MNLSLLVGVAALFQQTTFQGATTPPSGDTTGYWQQRVRYQITATLNEEQTRLQSTARLTYVNNSPDTLREMFFHQYLNAFRPGSKWSAVDERENRDRFQHLGENDIGYERLTEAPTVGGTPVLVDYPGAPDSTVMHFRLPRPLAPHDSLVIHFTWDARPSTVTRRQGRRGRTYDFAQWFPKVAVYDRRGWEPNPLVPAGELYGEFGEYDVTMIVRDDQVIASTGVPVSGDPGWARVSRSGPPFLNANAYGPQTAPLPATPAGYRAVRFLARDVHHFAWSASPDYRYEGAVYVRPAPPTHFRTWDSVAVNAFYKPGDDTTWGRGIAVERTIVAAKWLESLWGTYGYPQISNVHRLDPGGTEFPMMIMDGSDSQGLILHEFGHVFTYGILANNEWRSGWMDEGLTDYQTDWAQKLSPQDRDRIVVPPRLPRGYRVNVDARPSAADSAARRMIDLDLEGRTQPIGIPAYEFSEFGIYNEMIYDRGKLMYGQLRELMGDSTFLRFAHDYYNRWAMKHVDELAMRTSAERAHGKPLGWFFDEWVHGVGLMDYQLGGYGIYRDVDGYHTMVTVDRRGALRHPMPIGVKTASGWTIGRADPLVDHQVVLINTTEPPITVAIDPYHETYDWDWRNNVPKTDLLGVIPEPRVVFNWPWLNQSDRSHTMVALAPAAWYSGPQHAVLGLRAATNYLTDVDRYDMGIALSRSSPRDGNVWLRGENLYLPGMSRPLMGVGGGVNFVDGLLLATAYRKWDLSPYVFTPGPAINLKLYATAAAPTDSLLVPEQWSHTNVGEVGGTASYRSAILADSEYTTAHASLAFGGTSGSSSSNEAARGYLRADGSVGAVRSIVGTVTQLHLRLYGGIARNAPEQRAIFASTADPFETFTNDLFRPRGALLKQPNVNYLPLGGAGLRGFQIATPLAGVVAGNGELVQRLVETKGDWGRATVSLSLFGDVGGASASRYLPLTNSLLSDAGAGLIVRGRLYDRDVHLRLDAPVFVNQSGIAGGRGLGGNGSVAPRWTLSVGDLWR